MLATGKLDIAALPNPAEAVAALYERHRSALPVDRSVLQLAYQDADGDWMLLRKDQPWPRALATTRRLLLSTA